MQKKIFLLLVLLLLISPITRAHVAIGELESLSLSDQLWLYLRLGFEHILPRGFDHILFVLCLYLLNPDWKTILRQSICFTLAHSLTLGLAMYGVVNPPASVVEPLIAFSIVLVAVENMFIQRLRPYRIALIFVFGLIHGLGFASSLSSLGLPENRFLPSLLVFNVGVELGQLSVILVAFLLLGKWLGQKPYYHKRVVVPLSVLIACIASYWTVERLIA